MERIFATFFSRLFVRKIVILRFAASIALNDVATKERVHHGVGIHAFGLLVLVFFGANEDTVRQGAKQN